MAATRNRPNFDRRDLLAIALILAGYLLALLIMPVQRDFAILDDWTYVHSAEEVARGYGFKPSEYAQATIVTHTYWGALFATLFGINFTSFNLATMVMSLLAAFTFYVLLRRLGFEPALSGLGVALLTLNPYFINLSYSFMTEITFLAMLLLSCLLYYEGLARRSNSWLLVGSIAASLTFLTRQFGLAVVLAVLIWLLYARKLTLINLVAVVLLPILAVIGYFAWSRGFPLTFSGSVGREEMRELLRPERWVRRAAHFIYLALPLPGLLVPLWGKVRHWKVTAILSAGAAVAVFVLWQIKLGLVAQGESTLDELSTYWLQPLWPNPVLLFCIGAALTVWLVAGLVERSWPSVIALVRRRREPEPSDFLYLVGIILFVGTYLVSSGFLDRYWLPVLPFLIMGGLTWARGRRFTRLAPALMVLASLAIFGILVRLDQYDYARSQWQAGRWVVDQGVPLDKIENGYTWDGYFMHDEPVKRWGAGSLDIARIGRVYPPREVIDPEYVIDTSTKEGYHVVRTFNYLSRLGGMSTQEIYVLKRDEN